MDKNTLIAEVTASPISEERKQRIFALLESNELDMETRQMITDIIQEDIDADTIELMPEDVEDIKVAQQELSDGLAAVEKELAEDMEFVQTELNDLATTVAEVDKIVDNMEMDEIRADLQNPPQA